MVDKLSGNRILFVTGKGGVGKSILSAALGIAYHRAGHRPLLVEFFPDKRIEHIVNIKAEPYQETEIRENFTYINISSEAALAEYVKRQLILDVISKFVLNTKFYRHFSSTAPGLKELVAVGKLYDLEKKRDDDGRYLYDPIIVDSPQLGKFIPFVKTPQSVMNMFRIGPVKKEAEKVNNLILSDKCSVVIVSTPEEMAITEALEAKKELSGMEHPAIKTIIVNMAVSSKIDITDIRYYEKRLNEVLDDRSLFPATLDTVEKFITYVKIEKRAVQELNDHINNVPVLTLPLVEAGEDELSIAEELSQHLEPLITEAR